MSEERFTFYGTTGFGLEAVVARELSALGYAGAGVGSRPGWVKFEADSVGLARANVFLRAADRVLLHVAAFRAHDFGELFERTRAIAWERFLPRDAGFVIKGRSIRSQLSSVPACQRITKKAIVERLRSAYGVTTIPESGPKFGVEVSLLADQAELTLDTSGVALHRRGYRPQVGVAPLKETLAAGLVLLSFWKRGRPFLDPFCGTGTIAIEAALIARNLAPGRDRRFAGESWPFVPGAAWKVAREEARDGELPPLESKLQASDRDSREIVIARQSAQRAGVGSDIQFATRRFEDLSGSPDPQGCIITNPPYGDRIGTEEETRQLYRAMPEVFRRFPHWSFFVLTSRRDLERSFGQKADRRRKLYNGPTECTYYQFHGPRARHRDRNDREAQAIEPVFGGLSEKSRAQTEIFANRLKKRARHLRRWAKRCGIHAYRLYDGDIKEVPLTVDLYGDRILLRTAPGRFTKRSVAEEADWLEAMAAAAAAALGIEEGNVVRRTRHRKDVILSVLESGLDYEVHLQTEADETGTGTGLPIPERSLRELVRALSPGKRVLIPFARSGALTVAAAAGGARSTTSIERSKEHLEWARRNLERNGLKRDTNTLTRADVYEVLRHYEASFDLLAVVLPRALSEASRADLFGGLRLACAPQATIVIASADSRVGLRDGDFPDFESVELTTTLLTEDVRRKRLRAWRLEKRADSRVVK